MNPEEELEALESLIDQILKGLQDTLQSGETLSDEFQGMIAQELDKTLQRIDFLKKEISNIGTADQLHPEVLSEETKLLWILSGSNPEAFVKYLQTYPGKSFQQLLRNPTLLQQTIEQLQSDKSIGQLPNRQIDGIQKSDLQSSNVYGANYDPKSRKMLVRFQEGQIYEYDGIPPYIFKAFRHGAAPAKTKGKNRYGQWWVGKNPSLGAALNQYVKKANYNYRRVK